MNDYNMRIVKYRDFPNIRKKAVNSQLKITDQYLFHQFSQKYFKS